MNGTIKHFSANYECVYVYVCCVLNVFILKESVRERNKELQQELN